MCSTHVFTIFQMKLIIVSTVALNLFASPMSEALQSEFPGRLWVGLTENFAFDAANGIQIEGAINSCYSAAK